MSDTYPFLPRLSGSPRDVARGSAARAAAVALVLGRLRPIADKNFPADAALVRADILPILADRIQDTGETGAEGVAALVRRFDAAARGETAARFWIRHDDLSGQDWLLRYETADERARRLARKQAAKPGG